VLAAGVGGLESGDAVAEVDTMHEFHVGELVERAVDAGQPDGAIPGSELIEELLRRETAALRLELSDDRLPGATRTGAGASELLVRVLLPVHDGNGNHSATVLGCAPMRTRTIITALSILALLAGCGRAGQGSGGTGSGKKVVAAFYPIAYAAQRVDPSASVENLTPAGAEPHDIELSARDVERVKSADAVLYFGEGFMPALEKAVKGQANAVDLLAGVQLAKGTEGGESVLDPHVWLDPVRYAAVVRRVAAALGRPNGDVRLIADLKGLDAEYRHGLASCRRHQIVTSHAAFGYLAQRYGLEQIPLTGISPEAEPSARDLEALVKKVKAGGATTVFFETLVSPKLAQTVAREARVKTAVLDPIEGLTKNAIDRGDDYFSVMRANLAALRKALGCR
jgi:zinc transport system substrate-binding protein